MKSEIYHRQQHLHKKLNSFLSELTGIQKDYVNSLNNDRLIALKYALADINNILTLKTSLRFIDYAVSLFSLTKKEELELVDRLNSTKPNTTGCDIFFKNKRVSFLAEIKSTVPINNGNKFGIAQINSILDDAIKLHNRKGDIEPSTAYKFIGVLDIGEATTEALKGVFRPRNLRVANEIRERRNDVKSSLILSSSSIGLSTLSTDKIYIQPIRI